MGTGKNEKEEKVLKVTDFEKLKTMAGVREVEMPGFVAEETVVFRMKRPSLLSLASSGKVPNALMGEVNKLFTEGISEETMDKNTMKELHEILELMANEALVEPTYQELKDNGIELTDEQLMFIYNFSQRGLTALFPFR